MTIIVYDCRLGHGDIEEEGQAAPLRVETLTMLGIHVVSVSCGAEHTIALCQEGVRGHGCIDLVLVYVWILFGFLDIFLGLLFSWSGMCT